MKPVYLMIGVPGSGKSWVIGQIRDRFEHVRHDDFMNDKQSQAYVKAITQKAQTAQRPILAEAPFSISEIKVPLEMAGIRVIPIFILERPEVVSERYLKREKKPIPPGHLTRQATYAGRCTELKAFRGTSDEVLAHMKRV